MEQHKVLEPDPLQTLPINFAGYAGGLARVGHVPKIQERRQPLAEGAAPLVEIASGFHPPPRPQANGQHQCKKEEQDKPVYQMKAEEVHGSCGIGC